MRLALEEGNRRPEPHLRPPSSIGYHAGLRPQNPSAEGPGCLKLLPASPQKCELTGNVVSLAGDYRMQEPFCGAIMVRPAKQKPRTGGCSPSQQTGPYLPRHS